MAVKFLAVCLLFLAQSEAQSSCSIMGVIKSIEVEKYLAYNNGYCYVILHCSNYLYTISLPDNEGYPALDLTTDKEVKLDDSIIQSCSPKQ